MKKFFFTLLLAGIVTHLFAEKIDRFDIDITVMQSGELSVIERIDYNFGNIRRHGIFRDIPYQIRYQGIVKDIGLYDFTVSMDGDPVSWEKNTVKSNYAGDTVRLKIGSASNYVTGKHLYEIRYRVKKGVLPAAQNEYSDAIRWNIIGSGWNIPVYNIKADFHLPHSLSQANIALSVYTGKYGATASSAITKWITPTHLQVNIKALSPYEGATVELAYPPDSLDQNGLDNVTPTLWERFLARWHWMALAGFLLYFFNIYKKYAGYEDKRSIAVQYEPPKGLSLLQSALLLDRYADNRDFAAAVLELAYLGYLKIEQRSQKTDPVLIRLKKTGSLTLNQKYLLNEVLFKEKNYFVMKKGTKENAEKLKRGFNYINNNLYTWSVAEGYMEENPKHTRNRFLAKSLIMLLPVVLLTLFSLYQALGADALFVLLFPLAFGAAGIYLFISQQNILAKIQGLLFAGTGVIPLVFIPQGDGLDFISLVFGPLGVLLAIIAAMLYTYKHIGRFTPKGAYVQKHLLGLKEFVKRVKQDEIKRRLAEDPLYLEKMLPYAMLFGQTKHWLDFFELFHLSTPAWYHGNLENMRSFDAAVQQAATPPAQNSGGSGFSGSGGFSGGGGGGGGGGSW
ncbi:DUF2207 domain-containing protein [Sulfurovum sp. ST-21]|uniref:DUF2207 domain-containing protein n=1 Tax=Sulfurovum indicum TaxID=2779528 RepID=A0A7M1S0T5_9BACT|nr:DUF2207 domain-containing protein [Sulfurovum indicum]QOR60996.1 DUF2207 domain-containing protein [Sulfurovum indicum]